MECFKTQETNMLIQLKNRVILLEAVAYASISFPNEDSTNDWIELNLLIAGEPITLTGDEALIMWHALTRNATSLTPCTIQGTPTPDPISTDATVIPPQLFRMQA